MTNNSSILGNWEIGRQEKNLKKKAIGKSKLPVMDVGFYLLTPLLLGVFIGGLIDKKFETKPVWTIVLIILGAISSFYNLWRLTKSDGSKGTSH